MKFDIVFFGSLSEKIQVSRQSDKNNCTLHGDSATFISLRILLKMRNVSDKSCRENQNTPFVLHNFFLPLENREIMWKNMVEPDRP